MLKITDKIVSIIPKREFSGGYSEKFINWCGKHISTPENRVIIGVTALMSQPFIDLYNKEVDENTRKVSCARTIAKNIAGMLSGFAVRAGFIKLTQKFSKLGNVDNKLLKFFTPLKAPEKMTFAYRQYQNAMGMVFAIAGLCITNFAFDVPVTNYLTNKINKKLSGSTKKSSASKQ